ncbi:hypothetical protein [Streptomonospora litoralis]|uniref:Mce-associated membrane protein n=1 Tax=Streptomonospora litoralis TaxID=2498135 RepID=A0A4P6PWD4_9ACTN|nr:hypothetical protein [Streptomonospora litoralis]QBI52536.1 hypothetical protein EKD16_03630 [Streptomonospora litoralis]
MPKSLSEGQQRLVFGGLVVVLVAFGIYLSLGGWGGGSDTEDGAAEGSATSGSGQRATAQSEAAPPSPIPTTATQNMQVLDWFPFSEQEFKAAAATAQEFARAYGTIDYSQSPEEYYASMKNLATEEYAETLSQSSGAGALWQEMAQQEAVAEGRANVESVRGFDDQSVTFVVKAQSITEGSEGATEELGEFAVTVVNESGRWLVYDFQPADAGNFGDTRGGGE